MEKLEKMKACMFSVPLWLHVCKGIRGCDVEAERSESCIYWLFQLSVTNKILSQLFKAHPGGGGGDLMVMGERNRCSSTHFVVPRGWKCVSPSQMWNPMTLCNFLARSLCSENSWWGYIRIFYILLSRCLINCNWQCTPTQTSTHPKHEFIHKTCFKHHLVMMFRAWNDAI